jgi:hypothetical protein
MGPFRGWEHEVVPDDPTPDAHHEAEVPEHWLPCVDWPDTYYFDRRVWWHPEAGWYPMQHWHTVAQRDYDYHLLEANGFPVVYGPPEQVAFVESGHWHVVWTNEEGAHWMVEWYKVGHAFEDPAYWKARVGHPYVTKEIIRWYLSQHQRKVPWAASSKTSDVDLFFGHPELWGLLFAVPDAMLRRARIGNPFDVIDRHTHRQGGGGEP